MIHVGDCLEVMRTLDANSVDAVICDPPYGLGFMGKAWDHGVPGEPFWREALRVAKPGAHLLAFGGTRTFHRLACAIEDAGWEIRDTLMFVFGSGFPKSHNLDRLRGHAFCGCSASDNSMRGLRQGPNDAGSMAAEGEVADLFSAMQWENSIGGAGETGLQADRSSGSESEVTGSEQPIMEGRRNSETAERELQGRAIHPRAGLGEADGEVGRIRNGASAGDGGMVRPSIDEDGSGASRRPQAFEQPKAESGTLAGQSEPQTGGAWPLCSGCGKPRIPAGLGTALKPAWEPIIMARKPLIGTVAANVQAHGTGALNIDGCRVEGDDKPVTWTAPRGGIWKTDSDASAALNVSDKGRWPANLIHDGSDEVVALFPQSKDGIAGKRTGENGVGNWGYGPQGEAWGGYGGEGSAARFFAQHQYSDEDWLWLNLSLAVSAGNSLCLQNESVASAVSRAATAALPAGSRCVISTAPSTNVTATELKRIASALIETIQSTASACWHGQPRDARTQNASPARAAVAHGPTGTTTITVSHWKSDGSVDPVTFSITETNSEAGEKESRFRYCAKADRADRHDGVEDPGPQFKMGARPCDYAAVETAARGNHHPTVKPTDLMRWLCRLVTPPGGLVLDPFTGSGSTGRGAIAEGMLFVGIELDPDYAAIAEARIRAIQPGLSLAGVA